MTNEEAIKIIDKGLDIGDQVLFLTVDQMNEAKQMAIKALSQQTEYYGAEDMEGLYYCPICQQTTTVVKDGKCPKCGATMDELSTREQTEDAISRQAVLDMMQMRMSGKELYKAVYKLPPVNPQPKTGWIPVNERLPENSGNYLITYCLRDKIETQEAVYVKDEEEDKWLDITGIEITLAVIAWMPLPLPFEPQESEKI